MTTSALFMVSSEEGVSRPLFSPEALQTLMDDGVSPHDAPVIAAAGMAFANENAFGHIDAAQTVCHVLAYSEGLSESESAAEGELASHAALVQFFQELGIDLGPYTDDHGVIDTDALTNLWLETEGASFAKDL